ncbi:hypothetical protein ROHU_009275 [Labeo rohita]|uniref:Uncharacterized protein n=1 Tax=Labeo rohita TaxID=84645 RepID=A0A498M0D9_LABRO|nr:hypothetical protein ROHU_009275 [Labeo rohita]
MGGLSQQLLGDQDSRRCTRRGEETRSLAHQARSEKGKPAWEGSRGNCWEIKTPGVAPGGGRDVEFGPSGKEGERQTRLGGLSRQLMGEQDSGVAPGGEERWSLARREERERGEPAWEGSHGN